MVGKKVKYKGKEFTVRKSDRKNKQKVAVFPDGKEVHFGDPDMKEYPGTKRGNDYCSRSLGIAKKYNILGNPKSANFWSRKFLWNCKKDKSMATREDAGLK